MKTSLCFAALLIAGSFPLAGVAGAQVAGSTLVGVTVTESSEVALGWSVKKTILGQTVYNDAGDKVGKVTDLIITPQKSVSYAIVGAGGFIGIGRHDVAIPASQLSEKNGRLVLTGATKDVIKSLPAFDYAADTGRRDQLVANAEADIAKGRSKMSELREKASTATAEAKAKFGAQIIRLEGDVKMAEDKVGKMKKAGAKQWKSFEASVAAATDRLRKSLETTAG
jgi:sporulation protein YlmC with PRC-barrel domain